MRSRWAAVALLTAVTAATPAVAAVDPAQTTLRARDAYVSPRALGAGAPDALRRLDEAARRLEEQGRPVKLAIVAGPAGAPSMRAYAVGLRRALGGGHTLAVTAPRRPVVAVGARSPAEVTRRLRAARVGAMTDPVERVIAAAQAAAPEPTGGGTNLRKLGALLGVAVLGGLWAVAIGLRRERRRAADRAGERRAAISVYADALGSQVAAVEPGAAAPAAAELARAREAHAAALATLRHAREARTLDAAEASVHEGLEALSRARELTGARPLDDPFAGLCAVDPVHGPAVARLGGEIRTPVCGACRDAAARGRPPAARLVPVEGRPVPFRAAHAPARRDAGAPISRAADPE